MGEPAKNVENIDDHKDVESVWNKATLKLVNDHLKTVNKAKDERAAINARVQASQAVLVDKGFNKDALKAAIAYANTPEEKRQNFDLTYLYARKAVGHPVQDDLFVAAMQEQVNVSTKSKKDDDE